MLSCSIYQKWLNYRFRLGIKHDLTPGSVAIGVTLNSGVVNWSFLELLPPLRFRIGVVVTTSAVSFFMMFNSIRSFVLATLAAIADVDGVAADFTPEFVLMAIFSVDFVQSYDKVSIFKKSTNMLVNYTPVLLRMFHWIFMPHLKHAIHPGAL